MIPIERLQECPYCGLEFEQIKPNYRFCSYECYRLHTIKRHRQFDGTSFMGFAMYQFDLYLGYRRPTYWKDNEQDDLFCEFLRLTGRDS